MRGWKNLYVICELQITYKSTGNRPVPTDMRFARGSEAYASLRHMLAPTFRGLSAGRLRGHGNPNVPKPENRDYEPQPLPASVQIVSFCV